MELPGNEYTDVFAPFVSQITLCHFHFLSLLCFLYDTQDHFNINLDYNRYKRIK